jgi:hypothetical protein
MLGEIIAHLGKIVPRDIYHFFMSETAAANLYMNLFLASIFLLWQIWLVHPGKMLIMTVILKGWMGPSGLGRNVPSTPEASGGVIPPPLFDIVKSSREAEGRSHSRKPMLSSSLAKGQAGPTR